MERFSESGLPTWLVPDYWFMLVLAIIVGSLLTLFLWHRSGYPVRTASDLLFWGILTIFVGSKFLYYLQYDFPSSIWDWWGSPGLSLYGGLLGLLVAWSLLYQLRPYPVLHFLDTVTPSLAMGLFLGRIGCFLAGCNGGYACDLPWGVQFPRETSTFYHQYEAGLVELSDSVSLPAHPTQLYESLFGLVSFVLLLVLWRRRLPQGALFLVGILWYTVFRYSVEPFRADAGGLHPFDLFTFAQFVSMLWALACVAGLYLVWRHPDGLVASSRA